MLRRFMMRFTTLPPIIPQYMKSRQLSYNVYSPGSHCWRKPVVIIHDIFDSKKSWAFLATRLAMETCSSVLAVDMRNHGESCNRYTHSHVDVAKDVTCLCWRLNIQKPILIGHGAGAKAAMVMALGQPLIYSGLVVINASPFTNMPPEDIAETICLIEYMKFMNLSHCKTISEAQIEAEKLLAKSTRVIEPSFLRVLLNNMGKNDYGEIGFKCNLKVLQQSMAEIAAFPLSFLAMPYMGPATFVRGGKSNRLPRTDYEKIQQCFPPVEFKCIDAGHYLHIEAPDELFTYMAHTVLKESQTC